MFAGELALDGRLRPIRGAISMAMLAAKMGLDGVVLPLDNAAEAAAAAGIDVYPADSLATVVAFLNGNSIASSRPIDAERSWPRRRPRSTSPTCAGRNGQAGADHRRRGRAQRADDRPRRHGQDDDGQGAAGHPPAAVAAMRRWRRPASTPPRG
jgi:hypothetical protein